MDSDMEFSTAASQSPGYEGYEMANLTRLTLTTASFQGDDIEGGGGKDWKWWMDACQFICTCAGLLANLLTTLAFTYYTKGLSPIIKLFLQHQSLVDSWVCFMAIILLVQPYMWTSGAPWFDFILCLAWHGQGMYWGGVLISVWNLVAISVERFLAIHKPFTHQTFTKMRVLKVFVVMYLLHIIFIIPSYLQARYVNGECLSEYYFVGQTMKDFMYAYSIIWFFVAYAVPCGLFFYLYGQILFSIRKRQNSNSLGTSATIDKANAQLTKMAVLVTAFFIVALGWDTWYYLLGYTGVTTYDFNSPTQKIGVFFSVMNSVANPFIYLVTMPMFRESLLMTVRCQKPINTNQVAPSTVNTRSNAA